MRKVPCPLCGRQTAFTAKAGQIRFRKHNTPTGDACQVPEIEVDAAGPLGDWARNLAPDATAGHDPGVGRPPKLTPDVTARIVDAILEGNYQETAAVLGGISESTFHNWKARGMDARKQIEDPNASDLPASEVPYLEFLVAVETARAQAEQGFVRTVKKIADGAAVKAVHEDEDGGTVTEYHPPNHNAATWWLERSFPNRWGRRPVEISGPEGSPVSIEITARESLAQKIEAMASRAAEAGTDDDQAA